MVIISDDCSLNINDVKYVIIFLRIFYVTLKVRGVFVVKSFLLFLQFLSIVQKHFILNVNT
jgi:hypothetical protein